MRDILEKQSLKEIQNLESSFYLKDDEVVNETMIAFKGVNKNNKRKKRRDSEESIDSFGGRLFDNPKQHPYLDLTI